MPEVQAERLVVGITGASGVIYGLRALDALAEMKVESHLALSRSAALTLKQEAGLSPSDLAARVIRLAVTPVAISLMVRTEQGAISMPRLLNEPEAMAAPTSPAA